MTKNVGAPVEIDDSYLKNSKEKWGKEKRDAWLKFNCRWTQLQV